MRRHEDARPDAVNVETGYELDAGAHRQSSGLVPLPPVTEASAWMRATGGVQLRRIARMGLDPHNPAGPVIVAPLVGRLTRHGEADDRACDRCGRHVGAAERYVVLLYRPAARVSLVAGLCVEHARAEGVAL